MDNNYKTYHETYRFTTPEEHLEDIQKRINATPKWMFMKRKYLQSIYKKVKAIYAK